MDNTTDISELDSDATSASEKNAETKTPKSCCKKCILNFKQCKFHSVIVFLILLSLLGLLTQMIQGGYIPAITIDLQTHFNLSTSKIGFILSSFDIMGIFATPFLSFVGSKYNKCRILAGTGIVYAIGLVIFTLPYFIGGKYTINSFNYTNPTNNITANYIDYCKILYEDSWSNFSNSSTESMGAKTENFAESRECTRDLSNDVPYAIFIISQMVMSFGSAPLFPLGVTFLCDNLDERLHAMYTGNAYYLKYLN
ncbi:solute carrier organic anion transporter family member 3A1-like [Brachionus plicatilis]|uniref:Solute carrier organic anion transporter family member 3A1-like n=1 Tax=Brachionus plicatilis TaxID=10195 RepID=A0A3M7PKJ2_BRAPC|nr:solute carrier organic anion transporter family member 3A1-like [Brachionus plicatilis]